MFKRIAIILVTLGLLLVIGCTSTPVTTLTQTPQQTVSPTIPITSTDTKSVPFNDQPENDMEVRLVNQTWVSPAEVKIGNFYPGARAEWNIRIHNGNDASQQTEMYSVTTESGETSVDLKIKKPLASNDINKVSIASDNRKDNLIIISYNPDTKELNIIGFNPETKRIVTVEYEAWTEFFVSYMVSDEKREGYSLALAEAKDWIIIEDSSPVLAPKETKEILVVLFIPKDTIVSDKSWEFWTVAGEVGTGAIQLQMATRWCCTMRD